jgi:hypothetical protein
MNLKKEVNNSNYSRNINKDEIKRLINNESE